MLSFWSRKPSEPPADERRQIHREARRNGDGVIYASENPRRGVTFSFSGPADSRHSDEALKIAGRVYSNEADEVKENSKQPPARVRRRRHGNDEIIDIQPEEAASRAPATAKKHSRQRASASKEITQDNRSSRHSILTSEDAESVFSATTTTHSAFSQASTTTSNRHEPVISEISDSSPVKPRTQSITSSTTTTSRHSASSIAGSGFKHEGPSQVTYGLKNGGNKLFVSAPKGSREGNTLKQVEQMANQSGQASISEGGRHSIRGLLKGKEQQH